MFLYIENSAKNLTAQHPKISLNPILITILIDKHFQTLDYLVTELND